jgi:hypothetical protein
VGRVVFSLRDKVAALTLSVLAAVLVGATFTLAAVGLFWWSEIPLPRPTEFFVVAVVAVSAATFFLVLWQFIAGHVLPGELWGRMGQFFSDGNDTSP